MEVGPQSILRQIDKDIRSLEFKMLMKNPITDEERNSLSDKIACLARIVNTDFHMGELTLFNIRFKRIQEYVPGSAALESAAKAQRIMQVQV